jgi:anti-sigma-K factor RskA
MNHDTLDNLQSLQAAAPGPVSRRTLLWLALLGWIVAGAAVAALVAVMQGGL